MKGKLLLLMLISITIVSPKPMMLQTMVSVPSSSLATQPTTNSYVIFASSAAEYLALAHLPSLLEVYPNLKAVKLIAPTSQMNLLMRLYPQKIFRAQQFEQPQQIDSLPTIQQQSVQQPNALQDSNIMGVTQLWKMGYNGTGVVVAQIDNGVLNHPDLAGQVLEHIPIESSSSYPICGDHGTSVAGAMVGLNNTDSNVLGNAFGAKLVSVEAGCLTISGQEYVVGDWLKGWDAIANRSNEISVVNLSISGSFDYEAIIKQLEQAGVLVVASAGNSGQSGYHTVTGYGSINNVLTVGAVDHNGYLAYFSSNGPGESNTQKPDVLAPGYNVVVDNLTAGVIARSGTSFSSPFTAGAIATLISALRANNISYNVGTLKAAIMATATPIAGDSLKVGKGIVNATAAFEYLKTSSVTNNVTDALSIAPTSNPTGPLAYLLNLKADTETHFPLVVVASNPSQVSFSSTGAISPFIRFKGNLTLPYFSQLAPMYVNTSGAGTGTYSGSVIVTSGSHTQTLSLSITIGSAPKKIILMDLGHTVWDTFGGDIWGGTNIGNMMSLFVQQGYWVQQYDGILTSQVLSHYQAVWMPDPFDMPSDPNSTMNLMPDPLLSTEVTALTNFVNNGGSLFIDFLGTYTTTTFDGITYTTGTNATSINRITSQFGITANTKPVPDTVFTPIGIATVNDSSPIFGASSITKAGNTLQVSGNATALTGTPNAANLAVYDQPAGGRLLVAATNYWLDNSGSNGLYTSAGGANDASMANHVIPWLFSDQRVIYLSNQTDGTHIAGSYAITTNGSLSDSGSLEIRVNGGSWMPIIPTQVKPGIFTFSYPMTETNTYEVQAVYGNEYAHWSAVYVPPALSIAPATINPQDMVISQPSTDFTFDFTVTNTTTLTNVSITPRIDGVFAGVKVVSLIRGILKVTIYQQYLTIGNHTLAITVTNSVHIASYNYHFTITAGSSSSIPSDSTSTSQSSNIHTTSPKTGTTSSVASEETTSKGPFAFLSALMMLALLAVHKRSKKRMNRIA